VPGEIARYVVAEAVWAPSVHNTQPWRFAADGQHISLYADLEPTGYSVETISPIGKPFAIPEPVSMTVDTSIYPDFRDQ
jgi:hypothetical protein